MDNPWGHDLCPGRYIEHKETQRVGRVRVCFFGENPNVGKIEVRFEGAAATELVPADDYIPLTWERQNCMPPDGRTVRIPQG